MKAGAMSDTEREIRQRLKDDFIHYSVKCLKVRPKDGDLQPLKLNRVQLHAHSLIEKQRSETGKVRVICLKGRQQGFSTYVGARFYHRVTHNFGMSAFILTHALDATANLYAMAKRYHDHTPVIVRPQATISNTRELTFGKLDSGYKVGTAENKSVGRAQTIQLFHGSEVAFWSNTDEHVKGIMQAVPDAPGTEIILESTANGVGNYFHKMWQSAESGDSEYIAIFLPWYWQDEYKRPVSKDFTPTPEEKNLTHLYGLTPEQLAWRRNKIVELSASGKNGERAFLQEYPCNPNEAFQASDDDAYIPSDLVMEARRAKCEAIGPVILACDPARFGDDRTSIIRRRGRVAYGLESHSKKDNMEIVGILQKIIEREQPWRVCIDTGGGAGIIDRLKELGHGDIIVPVNFGSSSFDQSKYFLKRSEMWGEMRAWLEDKPCQIPDSDTLHADLCGLKYTYDSNSRLRIERKEDAKKRGIRSPDEADALALTFALPSSAYATQSKQAIVSKKLAQNFKQQLNAINKSVTSSYI